MANVQAPEGLTEEDMMNYLVLAESVDSPMILRPILNIVHNNNLPIQVRVRAILTLRPLARKMHNRVLLPLFKIFKTYTIPEEMRLAAFTVMIEHPTPSILLACVSMIKVEPSLTVQRFVYDSLLSFVTSGVPWPVEM